MGLKQEINKWMVGFLLRKALAGVAGAIRAIDIAHGRDLGKGIAACGSGVVAAYIAHGVDLSQVYALVALSFSFGAAYDG